MIKDLTASCLILRLSSILLSKGLHHSSSFFYSPFCTRCPQNYILQLSQISLRGSTHWRLKCKTLTYFLPINCFTVCKQCTVVMGWHDVSISAGFRRADTRPMVAESEASQNTELRICLGVCLTVDVFVVWDVFVSLCVSGKSRNQKTIFFNQTCRNSSGLWTAWLHSGKHWQLTAPGSLVWSYTRVTVTLWSLLCSASMGFFWVFQSYQFHPKTCW